MKPTTHKIFVADTDFLLCEDPRRFLESRGIDTTGGTSYEITRAAEDNGVIYTRKPTEDCTRA